MPLMKWLLFTMVAFITFGTLFIYKDEVGWYVEANDYESINLPMQLPTAFHNYGANESFGKTSETAKKEVDRVLSEHYGNAGLFVGPRDNSSYSSALGTYHNPNSISLAPNDLTAMGLSSEARTNLIHYHQFGRAIHELSDSGKGMSPSAVGATNSLDVIANTATSISRAGMKMLIDYSPGPLIEQLYTGKKAVAKADNRFVESDGTVMRPGSKLISLIDGTVIGDIWEALSIKPISGAPITLTTLILGIVVILLIIASVVQVLFLGRAGETIKKALVRIVVASVAIPAIGMTLHWGLAGAAAVTDYDVSQEERDARVSIGKHLNLADWAATGFMVPAGLELEIKNGKFSLSQSDIRILNTMSHYVKTCGTNCSPNLTKEFLESIPYDADRGFTAVAVYEDMQNVAKDKKNETLPHFSMRIDGDASEVSQIASIIGSSASSDSSDEDEDEVATDSDKLISYVSKRDFANTMKHVGNNTYKVIGGSGLYGISPISTYHLLYSDFSGNSIKTRTSNKPFTSVVYHADNGTGGTNADGSQAGTGMNPVIKFVAMITVALASLKGLGQIIMSGFGGIIAGTARSSIGSSAGFGQAVGGVIALVGGIIGMSFIINISFELLNTLYDLIQYLFKDVEGGADVMEPIASAMKESLPWFASWLGDVFKNVASFVISLIAIMALPKFGSIPIDLFAAKMAELPGNLSERAQQMENRFTGDFRSGGGYGGRSGVGSSVSSALKSGVNQTKGLGQAAAAGLGMAASLAGMGISKYANRDNKEGDNIENLSLVDDLKKEEGAEGAEGDDVSDVTDTQAVNNANLAQENEHTQDTDNTELVDGGETEIKEEEEQIVQDEQHTEQDRSEEGAQLDNESVHEQTGATQESIHEQTGATQETVSEQDNTSEQTSVQEGGTQTTDSTHEQTGAEQTTVTDSTLENTSQSSTQNTLQQKTDTLNSSETGGSVSGEESSTTEGHSMDATGGAPVTDVADNKSIDATGTSDSTQAGQPSANVHNEQKTHNESHNSANATASVAGDTTIEKSVDDVPKGESLTNTTDKNSSVSGTVVPTRGQKAVNAIKRAVGKENRQRALSAVGKGLQAAGGQVSAKRAGAAILHAGASTFGVQDKLNTKATLDRASGKTPQQTEQKKDVVDNKRQNNQQSINEQMYYHIQREREEQDKRRQQKSRK